MASCLRDLPPCVQTLIDEMGQHWRDLEWLNAAGGTPSARIINQGIMVGRVNDGTTTFVVRNQEDYVRNVVCNTKHRCWMCDLGFVRDDLANLACDGRGSSRFTPK